MKAQPSSSMSGAPSPAPSTTETIYQSRMGVRPTTGGYSSFASTEEGRERTLDPSAVVMSYTEINARMPTAEERGIPSAQRTRGG